MTLWTKLLHSKLGKSKSHCVIGWALKPNLITRLLMNCRTKHQHEWQTHMVFWYKYTDLWAEEMACWNERTTQILTFLQCLAMLIIINFWCENYLPVMRPNDQLPSFNRKSPCGKFTNVYNLRYWDFH